MTANGAPIRGLGFPALAAVLCVLAQCRLEPAPTAGRQENYVTVRLHDSLSRYDSVQILILADGDTGKVVGTIWNGRLDAPGALPSYRLDDSEDRALSVRVKGFNADGLLVLDMLISKVDGKQIVTLNPQRQVSPRLVSLALPGSALVPPFDPDVHAYAVQFAYDQSSLSITAAPEYAGAQVYAGTVNVPAGKNSNPIALATGENRITLTVTAADTLDQYVITATRAPKPGDTLVDPAKPDTAFPSAWKYKGLVLMHFDLIGMVDGTVITDFPVLLRLTADNFNFDQAANAGRDIRFAKADGTLLPFEIARWDSAARNAEIFIKPDTLRAQGSSNPILMYWGNPGAVAASDPGKVFPNPLGWNGVWHLEETGSGKGGEYRDATGRVPGTGGGAIPARLEGVVGAGQEFKSNGAASWISIPKDFDPGSESFSMSMWVYREAGEKSFLLIKDGDQRDDQRFQLDLLEGAGQQLSWGRNSNPRKTSVWLLENTWMHLGIVWTGSRIRLYVDGYERENWEWFLAGSRNDPVYLGARDAKGIYPFHGIIDEFWSCSKARSADYMRLIYESQKPWSNFTTLSPQ
jgi:hypothetical protein